MDHAAFRQIGKGFCGSVWAADRDGPAFALKREDGGPGRSVLKDSIMHVKIEKSILAAQEVLDLANHVNITQHRKLIKADDREWWQERSDLFPFGYEHTTTLITERILPFERKVREKLIDLFCLEQSRDVIKKSRKDEDCIVRPYIGRKTKAFSCPSRYFTLRNKPLAVNQMDELELPVEDYTKNMADALAVIYWHSKTDANDIEFVLAPARPGEATFTSSVLGPHRLWLLDFDCVNDITMDEAGIERAAVAFLRNDPFWPRPVSEEKADRRLWELFTDRFLVSSRLIMGDSDLPQRFIRRVEELGANRRANMEALAGEDRARKEHCS